MRPRLFGLRSSKVDLHGARLSPSNDYATMPDQQRCAVCSRLCGLTSEAFLIGDGLIAQELQMLRFDSDGNLLSDPVIGIRLYRWAPPSLVDVQLSTITHPLLLRSADEIWIAWIRAHRLPGNIIIEELVVRPFDRFGTPFAAETIVRSGDLGQLS